VLEEEEDGVGWSDDEKAKDEEELQRGV